jgi:hypothetical protein
MNGPGLFLGGVGALAVLMVVTKGAVRSRRATAAAHIAQVGTSPFSLLGRVLVTAGAIVGVQWLVIVRYSNNVTLLWVVLAIPALITSITLVRALTVTVMNPSRRTGGRR